MLKVGAWQPLREGRPYVGSLQANVRRDTARHFNGDGTGASGDALLDSCSRVLSMYAVGFSSRRGLGQPFAAEIAAIPIPAAPAAQVEDTPNPYRLTSDRNDCVRRDREGHRIIRTRTK